MDGILHISIANVNFKCPYCGTKHSDKNDKIYNRINKNKQGFTRVKCNNCGKRMGVSPDIKGGLQAYCISEEKRDCDCWLDVGRCYCDPEATDKEEEPQIEEQAQPERTTCPACLTNTTQAELDMFGGLCEFCTNLE